MEDEVVWIRKIKKGDTRFFRKLYDKHHRKLHSLCFRFTRNPEDAEEQLQEVFMKVLSKIDQFREESSFGTWVYRLTVNHLINFEKGNRKHRGQESLVEDTVFGRETRQSDLALALDRAVAALPDGFRHVFILHDREGFRHEEIGRILGVSPATSRSQLCRARMALRDQLKPDLMEASV